MKTIDAIAYFGNKSSLARALGVSPQAIQKWGVNVPAVRAYQIEVITNHKLRVKAA